MQTFKLMPEVEVVAIFDNNEKALAARKETEKSAALFTDLDEMLGKSGLNMAMILLPNAEAPGAAAKAAKAGAHLMIEKPCARTAAEFLPVIRAAKANKVKLSVGYCWPFHPISKNIREFVKQGLLGKPYSIEARMVTTQVITRDPKHFLFSKTISGGGILSWLGCHWLDLMHFLLDSEVAEVSAITAEVGGNGIDVEDAASVSLRYENGVVGTLHAGYYLKRAGDAKDMFIGIRGSLGAVAWEPGMPTVKMFSAAPQWASAPERTFSYTWPQCPAYAGQWGLDHMKDFVSAIRSGREPLVTGQNALRVLRILDAVYESARRGKLVKL
jgi:predicted dehydrogenase